MAMVREQDIFFALAVVVDFAVTAARRHSAAAVRHHIRAALTGAAAFALGYLPQLLAYTALNGRPRPSPLVARKMFWYAPHALQVLGDPSTVFSSGRRSPCCRLQD